MMKTAWRSPGTDAAVIVLLTVVVYLSSLRSGFVFDDRTLIVDNQMVKASDGLYRFWCTPEAQDYRPVTWSLWWLEWRLWGANAAGYHVVNVLLHAVDAVFVWMILRRLKVPGAWLAAVVFAIHPVNVATVAWISEQKNTLSMLFYALAILLYLRFDQDGRWRWYGLSLGAFLLALLSKTAVVMLPMVLLGCVWWRRERVRIQDWLCSVPYLAASLILALVTIVQHQRTLPETFVPTGGFVARLAVAGCVPWFYLSKALVPIDLTVIYPKWEIDPTRWISYVPGMIWLGCFLVFWWKRKSWGRPLLFGLGYFVVMLFPVLGFFDQAFYRSTLVADHWQYYSIIGVIALVVATGQRIGNRMGDHRRSLEMAANAAVLVLLGVATWTRQSVYADEETLWRDNVTKNPNAWQAHYNLGVTLQQRGRIQEAMDHWEQTLRIKPDYAEAHNNLGFALQLTGKLKEAIGHYEQALRIKPDYAQARCNLGMALVRLGKVQEAVRQLEQTLQIKPDYAAAHYNLALALEQTGQRPGAIRHYEQALRSEPDTPEAQNNLGWLLATLTPAEGGNPVRAVTLAKRACELTGNQMAPYLDTLAAAYAASGRFTDAIATAQKAIELARAAGQAQVAREIEARLQLYCDRHAYHQPRTPLRGVSVGEMGSPDP